MSKIGISFAVGSFCLLTLVGCDHADRRDEMKINRKTLSKKEFEDGAKEAKDIFKNVEKTGGVGESQTSAKTDIGQLAQQMAAKGAEIEKWHSDAEKGLSFEDMISPASFKSVASMRESLARLDRLKKIESEWIAKRKAIMGDLGSAIQLTPRVKAHMEENNRRLDAFLEAEKAFLSAAGDYLQLGLATKPRVDLKRNVIFWGPNEFPKYQALTKRIVERAAEVEKQQHEMSASVQEGLKTLDELGSSPK